MGDPIRGAIHSYVTGLAPAQWCQVFFILSLAPVWAIAALPAPVRRLLMDYGARETRHDRGGSGAQKGWLLQGLATVTSWGQVPHGWFITFYMTSVVGSAFWAAQYIAGGGSVLWRVAAMQGSSGAPPMTLGQVYIVWGMMAAQGLRRLYECVYVMKTAKTSKMWFVHWLLGVGFYSCLSIAVWIEGSDSILRGSTASLSTVPVKTIAGVSVYLVAAWMQNWCHRYLAGLKKYSLPDDGLFRYLVCPHYTCETLIYLSLAVSAAPAGKLINRTLLCASLFVVSNIGATASGTATWYSEKFGAESIRHKWKMIPLLF